MKLRTRYMSLLVILVVALGLMVFSIGPQAVEARRETDVTVDVNLPSDSTGIPGGTLAVRIFAPASAGDARYADGAPVAIFVPGGTDAGTLRPALSQAEDVIRIVFLFPGGTDPLAGRSSDGVYDYRGENSIAALRDVIRYAAGELADSVGRTIDDALPVSVLHDNIGLLGGSNGGNVIVAVAGEHGDDSAGHLRYVVQWESPVSSQIATVDLGRVRLDCPPGPQASLPAVNPRYLNYGPLVLAVDYSQLTYDPSDPLHPVFFDGTGDGHYTTVIDPGNGCQTPDLNLNGNLELNEDFPLSTFSDGVKQFYSSPVTQALADQNVFGGSWPTDVATPPQAIAFWSLREAVRHYPAALGNIPDLEGMVLTSVVDHVQTAPDHPHIHQAFDGWDGNGAWVKINPARDYVLEVDPALSSRTDLPDNAANTAPADWTDASSYAFPDGLEEVYFAAAVHEMADRTHTTDGTPTPTSTSTPTPTSTPTKTPTPTETFQSYIYLPLVMKAWQHQPWSTPTATPTPTSTPTSTPEPWVYEETVFYSDDDLSRPELCFVGDRAYLALRKIVTPEGGGPKDRLIVLKVFDVDAAGDWTDRTADLFPDDPHVLYGPGDPNPAGDFTDQQLICTDEAFFVVFEAHYKQEGQDLKRTVVRRYLPDWSLDRQTFLFDGAVGLTEYKMDDPGAALLNGTLFTWVVKLSQSPIQATGFVLYGVDPVTLEVTVDDGAGNPVVLDNPEHAPFAGVMDFVNGEYRLLSSPHDAEGEPPFSEDGLVEYHYNQAWQLVESDVVEHPFGNAQPAYATGRIWYNDVDAWGFTVVPEGQSQDGGAIGQAWVRLADADGGATYFLASDNDATPEDDDTRHTELAIHNGKGYVSYFHIAEGTDRATTIKRYRIPTAEEVSPLYFFYAIHTHVQGDWYPYTDLGMTEIYTQVANNMIAAIDGIAQVLDDHGAKGSWEVVYGTAKGLCEYQGNDHVFQKLVDSGHEVGVHAHRTAHIESAFENLEDYCGITANVTSGFMVEASDAGVEGAQETVSDAIEEALSFGMTVGTENLSPADSKNPFGELCDDQIGVGNDMWADAGNLMFPWRPDYINQNICADNPEADMVFVDHVPPGWMILPDQGKVDVLTDANFDQLREQFDAALAYMEENRPDRIAAWGFVSHINEYAVGSQGENPPHPAALAALDQFLDYVDSKVAEGRVVYATASEIAGLAFPTTAVIDTHVHLDGKYSETGAGGPSVVTDFDSAAATALAKMDELGIQKSLLMPPPFSPEMVNSPLTYDYTDLAAVVQDNPERFGFLGGGGLLNPMIHAVPSDQVTEQMRQEFQQKATAIAEAGAAGFGEMAALHLSFFDEHPFLEAPPDHELFLLLADVAASYDMPIDLHMEAVVSDLELRPMFGPPNPQPPDAVHANIDAFERLLSHNRDARIVWVHVGWDNTGDMTVELLRQLLEDHPNLYMSLKVLEQAGLQIADNRPVDESGIIRPEWVELIADYPDRFVMGGDQFYGIPGKTPQRPGSTEWAKQLVDQLPEELAGRVLEDNVRMIYRLD